MKSIITKDSFEFSGVKICRIKKANLMSLIEEHIENKEKLQICATPVYALVLMQRDIEFRNANNSSISIADGMPLVWISKLFKKPIPERIAGADLFEEMCRISSDKGYKFFFLGSTEETLAKIFSNLKERFPSLKIVGAHSPPFKNEFNEEENLEIINKINDARPDILWVGMTAPKQEKWIYRNLDKLDVKVAIGIGAVFDFVAGRVKRAPKWMQRSGLEWFWRLIHEPRRLWKRYLIGNTVFMWLLIRELIKVKILRRHGS